MLIESIFQYDSNILLAAIISLLLVILFVLLLHIYAKWFLVHARRRRSSRNSAFVLSPPPRIRQLNTYSLDTSVFASPTKGLDSSVIASIPLFVYGSNEVELEMDCVICLSVFEEKEIGRRLPKCGHEFHVQCIDMWLSSHSNCPICRSPIVNNSGTNELANGRLSSELDIVVEGPSFDENENENRSVERGEAISVSSMSFSSSSSSSSSSSAAAAAALSSQMVAFGDSLKRIMSRNRSERKVHPSASVAVQQPVC